MSTKFLHGCSLGEVVQVVQYLTQKIEFVHSIMMRYIQIVTICG